LAICGTCLDFIRNIVSSEPHLSIICNKGTLFFAAFYLDYIVTFLGTLGRVYFWKRDAFRLWIVIAAIETKLTPFVISPTPDFLLADNSKFHFTDFKP
jgi:hypothetical protein